MVFSEVVVAGFVGYCCQSCWSPVQWLPASSEATDMVVG